MTLLSSRKLVLVLLLATMSPWLAGCAGAVAGAGAGAGAGVVGSVVIWLFAPSQTRFDR